MDNAHQVAAFVVFQVVFGLAAGFVQGFNQGDPLTLSATEMKLSRSGLGGIASLVVVASFVLGIVLLVRLAEPLGWGLAIATLVGSWFLHALLRSFLIGRMRSGLGFTLPGVIALFLLPAFGCWAWFAAG